MLNINTINKINCLLTSLYLSLIIDLIYEDREREKGGGLIDIGIYWVETYKSC